ncbi:MAG: metal-dependent hydrolase [Pseudomonadales bacterium]
MSRRGYQYTPKCVERIVVRDFAFDFPADLDPVWAPEHVVRALLFNGLSLTMPYLEPFLVRTMRETMAHVDDPALLEDMRAFSGQEAQHYRCHRRLNELLKANGYPVLADVESRMVRSYERLSRRSLRTRLAYSAGFECMTNGFTSWFINHRTELFGNTSPHVASFWLMHMIEETEHKTVAFDAYMTVAGGYLPRAIGVFHGSFHVLGFGYLGLLASLKQDGELWSPRRLWETLRETASIVRHVGPYLLRALRPGHNPRSDEDPRWMQDWVAGHVRLPEGAPMPLVDTGDPAMPVPFPGV